MKNKKIFIALLSVFAISGASAALATGCDGCGGVAGKIDAPTNLEEELGAYVIPDYEVVDSNGMILAGYNVYLKSVKNADGEELAERYGSAITVDEAGVYSFVYSAGSKKVKDVTVSIDFADRTAPTINCDESTIPQFYIKGNSYKVPQYTLSGDFDRSKCWAKVFYIGADNKETEVKVDGGRFLVDKEGGSYAIRVHVEDAVGNANDYEYIRHVDGPENVVEHKVLYLDEEFGERQVSCYQSYYTGGYVSKDAEGAHAYEDENGAYKVSFNGETATKYNEGLVVMNVPAIIDINEYEDLYMYVYNDSGKDIIMGSQWWNDTKVEAGKWTKLTWNTRVWGYNVSADNVKQIGLVDITGMTIRFIFDYGQTVIPNGDFYLSAMYGTPKIRTELECGENILLSNSKYYLNDVVELNAVPVDGKTVDYYTVDGEILPGTSFTVTKEHHEIEVFYVEGGLSADNMTWATPSELNPEGSDAQTQYLGTDEYWVMSHDVYGVNDGWKYFGVYIGGSNQLLGFELSDEAHSKFSGYGGTWKWMDGVALSPEIYSLLRGATQENPVKAVYVRRGEEIRTYLISGDKTYLIGCVQFSEFGVSGNNFGYGGRINVGATVVNFEAVAGETKTNLYFEETFAASFTVDGETAEGNYYLGDKITLTPAEAPENKLFAYFNVNGNRIEGNEFVLNSFNTAVQTVYTDIATVNLAEGIKTSDGKTGTLQVAKETYIVLDYTGKAPAGKYFIGFTVDGEEFVGNEIYVTADTHEVDVLYGDKVQTGADKLNDITDTDVIYSKDNDGNDKWTPASVEHVIDFTFDGDDGAVDENSVLKIVTGNSNGENSFAFDNSLVDNLDEYKEIYFYAYTEANGIKAGGWWCGDTVLVAGKWTKVSFGRELAPGTIEGNGESKVWEDGIEKFAFRIFGAPAGVTVYVTAVYGLPYPDAEVTKSDRVTVSAPANGKNYKVGETVTLTASQAPEGKAFAYFTANGERIEGNTFVLDGNAEFGVVFNDISTVTLGSGVTAENAENGKVTVGRDATVTLVFNGEVPSGKYFAGFKVDGEPIQGKTFIAESASHSVEAMLADKVQTGSVKLNEISTVETDGLSYHPNNADWAPESIEYADVKYNGADGAVDEGGSLKVTLNGNEQAFALNKTLVNKLDEYEEIYFYVYTEADGLKAGSWWCGDTVLVPEKWTKVSFSRSLSPQNISEQSIWVQNSIDKFAYRIMGAHKGDVIYVTAVYGVHYGEVSVTVEESVQDYVTVTGTFREGQIVTLSHSGAPEGQAFAYFTVNGEKCAVNTYKLGKDPVVIGAVFTDITLVATGSGVATSDGENEYGRGAAVTLIVDGETAPAGKIFDYFTVDGERITGDKFVTSKSSHTVGAVFVESVQDLTWITSEEAEESDVEYEWQKGAYKFVGISAGEATHWAIEAKAWGFTELGSAWYSIEFLVGNNANLQIRLHSAGNASIYAMGANHDDGIILVNQLDARVIDVCKSATQENPVTFTAIRNGAEYYILLNGSLILKTDFAFNTDDNKFGLGGTDCGTWLTAHPDYDYQYRIGEQTSKCLTDVKVTCGTNVTSDSADGVYKLGETVELTAEQAPAGQKFAYFVVDGVRLEGSSFTATKHTHNAEAVYSEISTLTLGDGVVTADGETEYARGVKVILSYDPAKLGGKVVDYYLIDEGTDSEQRVPDGEFVTSSATHTVKAVLISSAEDMTWRAENASGAENVNAGECIYVKKAGNANDWALRYTLTSLPSGGWGQLTGVYLGATSQIASLQFSGSTYTFNLYGGPVWSGSVTVSDEVADIIKNASDSSPVTLAFVKNGNYLSAYATKEGETYFIGKLDISAYVTNANATDSFGFAYRDTNFGVPVIEGDIEYVINLSKVELFAGYLNANSVNGQTSETQINNIRDAVVHSGTATLEYVTEIPEGLSDANVKEAGVMKVSATDNELALNVKNVFTGNLDDYEEIYFWVYVEDDGLQAGTYWCANTDLTANQWTKVKITRDTNWAWNNGVVYNGVPTGVGEQKVYEAGSQVFVYRLMNGNGKVFYVSSLYGVPKNVEPVVDESTTEYSVVSGDEELTSILNDNFFPDAE